MHSLTTPTRLAPTPPHPGGRYRHVGVGPSRLLSVNSHHVYSFLHTKSLQHSFPAPGFIMGVLRSSRWWVGYVFRLLLNVLPAACSVQTYVRGDWVPPFTVYWLWLQAVVLSQWEGVGLDLTGGGESVRCGERNARLVPALTLESVVVVQGPWIHPCIRVRLLKCTQEWVFWALFSSHVCLGGFFCFINQIFFHTPLSILVSEHTLLHSHSNSSVFWKTQ